MDPSLLIVSPVRNEAAHIERVVRAVAGQELRPACWIVIDDSSTDGTLKRLRALEQEVSFMTVIATPDDHACGGGRDRLASAAEAKAFNRGLSLAPHAGYTHIVKLDGDIELPRHYLRRLTDCFAANPGLGVAGGVLVEPAADGGLRRIAIPPHHVHGALKCYSSDCFAAIGGVQERLGWDTIDETYARMMGFETRTFADLVSIHHRPIASADGTLRGRARHGECAYAVHYSAAWVLLRSLKVARTRPLGLSGAAFLYGYARAAVRRGERVPDAEFRQFTRRELRRRMLVGALAPFSRSASGGRAS